MRYAIVSDVHANPQAWQAILKDARLVGMDTVLSLGDVVGYGPRPAEVLESVCAHVGAMILGDHDAVVCGRLPDDTFADDAREVIDWTRARLSAVALRLFAEMDPYLQGDEFIICHSQADEPERFNYIRNREDARASLTAFSVPLVFSGHTHQPGVYVMEESSGVIREAPAVEFAVAPGHRYFVNVGSVGDPVHGPMLASYALYDSDTRHVMFRFVPFDVAGLRREIHASGLPVLPHFLRNKAELPAGGTQDDEAIQVPLMHPNRRSGPIRYVSSEELHDTSRTVRLKTYDSPLLRRRRAAREGIDADDRGPAIAASTGEVPPSREDTPDGQASEAGAGAAREALAPKEVAGPGEDVPPDRPVADAADEDAASAGSGDGAAADAAEEAAPDQGTSGRIAKTKKQQPGKKIVQAAKRRRSARNAKQQAHQDAIKKKLRARQQGALAKRKAAEADNATSGADPSSEGENNKDATASS